MKNLSPVTSTSIAEIAHQSLQRIIQLGGSEIKIPAPANLEDAKSQVLHLVKQRDDQSIQIGFLLILIKKAAKHGEWLKWVAENNLDRRRVSEDMMIARTVKQYEEKGINLMGVGKKLLIEASSHPVEEITDIIDDIGETKFNNLSVPDLLELLEKKSTALENSEQKIHNLQSEKAALIRERDTGLPQTELPEFVTAMRLDTDAHAHNAIGSIDSLEQMLNDHVAAMKTGGQSREWHDNANIATTSLHIQIRAVATKAGYLLRRMHDTFGIDNDVNAAAIQFTESEQKHAMDKRAILTAEHKLAADRRKLLHENKPKKRGRKKKQGA